MYTVFVKQEGYPMARLSANTKKKLDDLIYFNFDAGDKLDWSEDKYTVIITKSY